MKSQESVTKSCHEKKKTRLRSAKEKSIKNWFSIKKKRLKMSEKALKFNNIRVNKKDV